MSSRIKLHEELKTLIGSGSVYFQPPALVKMNYPCIVYGLDNMDMKHADDKIYLNKKRYSITVIDKNPDSIIPDKILGFPLCGFGRFYTADNLNHWVFDLYY